jgi:isoquinoline 1-oxidoreductase beta subunit
MQGGILHGLSAALWGQTTFSGGRASSRNFSNTRVVKMNETPAISVKIFESGAQFLAGLGDVAVPPVASALANACAALNGTRVRSLPFFPGAGMGGGQTLR